MLAFAISGCSTMRAEILSARSEVHGPFRWDESMCRSQIGNLNTRSDSKRARQHARLRPRQAEAQRRDREQEQDRRHVPPPPRHPADRRPDEVEARVTQRGLAPPLHPHVREEQRRRNARDQPQHRRPDELHGCLTFPREPLHRVAQRAGCQARSELAQRCRVYSIRLIFIGFHIGWHARADLHAHLELRKVPAFPPKAGEEIGARIAALRPLQRR